MVDRNKFTFKWSEGFDHSFFDIQGVTLDAVFLELGFHQRKG